jgi:quercetin dioxygenase-like cupin family protein
MNSGRGSDIKSMAPLGVLALSLCAALPAGTYPPQGFQAKVLLQKDLTAYMGSDMLLSVGEVTLAPGAVGTKHRHPGPTFVYVIEGAVEVELEGTPAKVYRAGDGFYEDAHQLHVSTKNASASNPARILAYHLSHKGEPLTVPAS